MSPAFLLYGATGFTGQEIARLVVECGLQPILAGRNATQIEKLGSELSVEHRIFDLSDTKKIEQALKDVTVVLNCAGPFRHTYKPMVEACLQTRTHYLDITGEIPVYEALAALDAEANECGIMLLPGTGFDVVPTDCLALHLKERLPSATHLRIAFKSEGPAGLPPGTQRTFIEMMPYGSRVRRNGQLEIPEKGVNTLLIDFGQGPTEATRFTWGDVFMAYYSTGIPNIENYSVRLRAVMGSLLKHGVRPGSTAEERAWTRTHVWGEVVDDQGRRVVSRLHGPEAGVVWTARAALAVLGKVLAGNAPTGFQTPAKAYGADLVMECEGVTREDVD